MRSGSPLACQGIDRSRLIFIDETWAKTNMTRLRGRAPRGAAAGRHARRTATGSTTTLIGAPSGPTGSGCSAVVDGRGRGDVFAGAFVAQVLLPAPSSPGDVVMPDNLSSHRAARGRARPVKKAGAEIWSTCRRTARTCSPIEPAFSEINKLLRQPLAPIVLPELLAILDAVTPRRQELLQGIAVAAREELRPLWARRDAWEHPASPHPGSMANWQGRVPQTAAQWPRTKLARTHPPHRRRHARPRRR